MVINCTSHDVAIYRTCDCYMRDGFFSIFGRTRESSPSLFSRTRPPRNLPERSLHKK